MRILFCNIAWMEYYKGILPGEVVPNSGGSFVKENQDAHEKYNFEPVYIKPQDDDLIEGEYCLGFVETKSTSGSKSNQLHIEKIAGCKATKNDPFIDDVLVVYCATHPAHNHTAVVGWYKHARVYRVYQLYDFPADQPGMIYTQSYNAIAKAEDCTLLPLSARSKVTLWKVPRPSQGASYGFGRANVWYAEDPSKNPQLRHFLDRIIKQIVTYDGDNWLRFYPKE